MITERPIVDWSDDELRRQIRVMTPTTAISYADILRELDRRAAARQARASVALTVVSLAIALAALLVTALKA